VQKSKSFALSLSLCIDPNRHKTPNRRQAMSTSPHTLFLSPILFPCISWPGLRCTRDACRVAGVPSSSRRHGRLISVEFLPAHDGFILLAVPIADTTGSYSLGTLPSPRRSSGELARTPPEDAGVPVHRAYPDILPLARYKRPNPTRPEKNTRASPATRRSLAVPPPPHQPLLASYLTFRLDSAPRGAERPAGRPRSAWLFAGARGRASSRRSEPPEMLQLLMALAFSAAPLTLYVPPVRSLSLFVEAMEAVCRDCAPYSHGAVLRFRLGLSRILAGLARALR
jgi:hypothetical protein